LLFQPDVMEMTLYKLNTRGRYVSVKPNEGERYHLPELELELAMLDNWVRFWFRGELLPLPGDLVYQVQEYRRQWQEEKRRADDLQRRLDDAEKRAQAAEQELARLRGKRNH
jgi:hypothetical protein